MQTQSPAPAPKGGSSSPSNNSNGNNNGKGSGGLSSWYVPVALGTTAFVLAKGCSDEETSEPLTLPRESFDMFATAADAIEAVKNGQVTKNVEEVFEIGAADSAFFFHSTEQEGSVIVLRGLHTDEARTQFIQELREYGATVSGSLANTTAQTAVPTAPPQKQWYDSFEPFIMPATYLALGIFAIRSFGRGFRGLADKIGDAATGKSDTVIDVSKTPPKDRFEHVGGLNAAKAELAELVEAAKEVMSGRRSKPLPSAVILAGPTGTGKTFLGRVVAGEAGCIYVYTNAGKLMSSPFQGGWTKDIHNYFKELRKVRDAETKRLRSLPNATGKENAVIFAVLDEADSITQERSTNREHGESRRAVNALLTELDGGDARKNNDNIVVFMLTNHIKSFDTAVLRPGRTPIKLEIGKPDTVEDRLDVLAKFSKQYMPKEGMRAPDMSVFADIAATASGLNADQLTQIVKKATELAKKDDRKNILEVDVYEAFQHTVIGPVRESLERTVRKQLIAAHEHGHGFVAHVCGLARQKLAKRSGLRLNGENLSPVVISFRPRGESLGRVMINSDILAEQPATREDLLLGMLVYSAGRAGEIATFGLDHATIGVLGDDSGDFARMSFYLRSFVSAGLIDGSYSASLSNVKDVQLPLEYRELMEWLGDDAVEHATKILRSLGAGTLETRIIGPSLDQEFELVGSRAKNFYSDAVPTNEIDAAVDVVLDYISNLDERCPFITSTKEEKTPKRKKRVADSSSSKGDTATDQQGTLFTLGG